jgi:cell division protein FtsL
MTNFARKLNKKQNLINPLKQKKIDLGQNGLKVLLLVLIIFVGLSYLYYINQTATGGFNIKGMENQIEEIKKNNKNLQVRAAEMQSLSNIEKASEKMQMVATTTIEYLPAVGSVVAVR